MAKWFYNNENGEKIEVTGGQLKGLAKAGQITPDTIVETEDGKTAPARKVKGLTFVEAIPPEKQPTESEPTVAPPIAPDTPSTAVNVDAFNDALNAAKNTTTSATTPSTESNQFTAEEQAKIDRFCSTYRKTIPSGSTLLHFAAGTGDAVVARYLVSTGSDVNAKDSAGLLPLHYAANIGNVEVAKFLVSKGADVNAKNSGGNTSLHAAVIGNKSIEIVEFLISNGADANAKDNGGSTPLHAVAVAENVAFAKILVAGGANVNAVSNSGETPLHQAAWCNKNIEVVRFLVSSGADINAKEKGGKSPLDMAKAAATLKGEKAVLQYLSSISTPPINPSVVPPPSTTPPVAVKNSAVNMAVNNATPPAPPATHPLSTQTTHAVSAPSPTANLFCTNCGKPVSEQAVACMTCGAAPTGHKKFCRHCGIGLNPEQVICIKCGAGVNTTDVPQSVNGGTTSGTSKNRIVAAILAFLLGIFGAHKFYLGNWGWGLVFVITTLTGYGLLVTGIIAILDGIKLLAMTDEVFADQYCTNGNSINSGTANMATQNTNALPSSPPCMQLSTAPETVQQPTLQPMTFMGSVFGQCPFCKKCWVRELIKKTFHSSSKHSYTTQETDGEIRDRAGEVIATTTRPVRRSFTITLHRYDYRCKKCGRTWYYFFQ
ncbi:MAG: ankyrin repeat domain-containing protein [Planctomycetaceae bacterium]|jgi:ankyrin repeat protein/TM2 domain-containing membrane protein YozV|nr:ankyrin repeat domain-containing protein [Planctomycetaceae bacterium]